MLTRSWSRPELAHVERMLITWKESYYAQVGSGEGWEVLCDELRYEIHEYVHPYLWRLYRMKMIEPEEFEAFLHFCEEVVEDLRRMIEEKGYAG